MESKKQEKFRIVEESVLESVSKIGRSLNISSVSQKSKVSRPWIYKYFGKNTSSIIVDSIKHAGRRFAELDRTRLINSKNELVVYYREIVLFILRDIENHPWIPDLYYKYFGSECEIGQELRAIESEFSRILEAHCRKTGMNKGSAEEFSRFFPKTIMSACFALAKDSDFHAMGVDNVADQLCRVLEAALDHSSDIVNQ